nr:MAG TPA: hypothetical protein [Caudoviricetes sp.]
MLALIFVYCKCFYLFCHLFLYAFEFRYDIITFEIR